MRKNLNITQIDGWEKKYDHVYIKDKCMAEHPNIVSYSESDKKKIYKTTAQSEGLKSIPNHEWYLENGYMINIPKRTWRELYEETEKREVTEEGNSFEELAERLRYQHRAVMYINRELGITKQENWKDHYEYAEIGKRRKKEYPNYNELSKTQRRYIDTKLAKAEGLEPKDGHEMHHENGYMINVAKIEHKKERHIGDIGLLNQLNKLKELKGELPKKGLEKIGHDEKGNTIFRSKVEQTKIQKMTPKIS